MATAKPKPARKATAADTTAAVDTFMSGLEHPHKAAIEALRGIILDADASIAEGVKWNVPSFRTTEYFATMHLRTKPGVSVILHLGAKVRDDAAVSIKDPAHLLKWLAKDRAMVQFAGLDDVRARAAAFQAVVRQWLRFV